MILILPDNYAGGAMTRAFIEYMKKSKEKYGNNVSIVQGGKQRPLTTVLK